MTSRAVTAFAYLLVLVSSLCPAADEKVPHAKPRPLMKNFMGINGHTIQFRPALYRPVCELVRDYHPLEWDVGRDPANPPRFPKGSAEKETWLDWRNVYGPWRAAGFRIDACIHWTNEDLPPARWTDVERQAFGYGKAFAEHFGSGGQRLVESIEIGNEPGTQYDDKTYHEIFQHMARGVRAGDPQMTIATCTVNVAGDDYSKPLQPFVRHKDLFDVVNVHQYALKSGWPTWERSHPEDESVRYVSAVQEVIAFRDAHLPGKQVWLTEFGYDASTRTPKPDGPAAKWVDVDDDDQARYIVRSFLVFSKLDLDRAYLYFFNDDDEPSFHASSGITRKYQPKPSYYAMRHLYRTLGEYRLTRPAREEKDRLFVYEYANGTDPKDRVYVAWAPTAAKDGGGSDLAVELPAKPLAAERMPLADGPAPAVDVGRFDGTRLTVRVDGSPVYIRVRVP